MAIMDSLGLICENFDLDQETGTFLATNQIDLGGAAVQLGTGEPVYLNIAVEEAFTDGGDSATLEIRLVSDDTASIHASTSTIHFKSTAFLKAALPIGQVYSFVLPQGATYERYLGINFVVATAGFDAGEITAWLSLTPGTTRKVFADATN